MNDEEAVEALTRFGLTVYEARTFLALQKLGVATASEVSEIADVPRSQVYGAAEGLEERGLVDVQPSSPTRYRPVGIEEARSRLYREVRSAGEPAFDHLEQVKGSRADRDPAAESVWTVEGNESIVDRAADLIEAASDRVVYATDDPDRVEPRLAEALEARAREGVSVIGMSKNDAARERLDALEGVSAYRVPAGLAPEISTARLLLVDRDGLLLSVIDTDYLPETTQEVAIWGSETGFASVLVAVLAEWMENTVGLPE